MCPIVCLFLSFKKKSILLVTLTKKKITVFSGEGIKVYDCQNTITF